MTSSWKENNTLVKLREAEGNASKYEFVFVDTIAKTERMVSRFFASDKLAILYAISIGDMFNIEPDDTGWILEEDPKAFDEEFNDYISYLKKMNKYDMEIKEFKDILTTQHDENLGYCKLLTKDDRVIFEA